MYKLPDNVTQYVTNIKLNTVINIILILLVLNYISFRPKEIATIDIPLIINAFLEKNNNKDLTNEERNKLVDDFSVKLSLTLERLSNKSGLILVPKQAVIAGGTDLTQKVKDELLDI